MRRRINAMSLILSNAKLSFWAFMVHLVRRDRHYSFSRRSNCISFRVVLFQGREITAHTSHKYALVLINCRLEA